MRVWAALCLLSAIVLSASGTEISHDEYKRRRAKLREALPDSLIVIFGATEQESGEIRTGFFQSPDFYYLTGWNEPNAVLVLTPSSEILLIPKRDKKQEQWTGPKLAPGDPNVQAETGFESVLPVSSLESESAQVGRRISIGGIHDTGFVASRGLQKDASTSAGTLPQLCRWPACA